MGEIVHCQQCKRVKDWDDDCPYIGCNPDRNWREMTAAEVYSALHPEGVTRNAEMDALRAERDAALRGLAQLRAWVEEQAAPVLNEQRGVGAKYDVASGYDFAMREVLRKMDALTATPTDSDPLVIP
jgi:hypothetical protein